jgi:hypothetical protein
MCQLCKGSGVVHHNQGGIYEIASCPNCESKGINDKHYLNIDLYLQRQRLKQFIEQWEQQDVRKCS